MATPKKFSELTPDSVSTPGFLVVVLNPAGDNTTYDQNALIHGLSPLNSVDVGNATLALTDAHRGKLITLDHANSAISWAVGAGGITAGFTCAFLNLKGTDYPMPTPTGAGATLVGPVNGDTRLRNGGVASAFVRLTAVRWRGESIV